MDDTTESNKTKKFTISLIVRWLFGIFFILMFIGALLEKSIIGAILLFLAAIISLPITSQAIEKSLNISLSGALRFVVVILLFAGGLAVLPQTETPAAATNDVDVSTESNSIEKAALKDVDTDTQDACLFDWNYYTTSSLGEYYKAPQGYNYAVVTIYLKNNADSTISTNPWSWKLIADGIKYNHDSSSYSEHINTQVVDVGKGGEMENSMVFIVKGTPAEATLEYTGFGPDLVRIEYY
ncbi:MAG: DUF4352 domain-containing protein [Methanosarcina sp.]|nr:DUF4352 domain-containing protein [Methanosarcina sp.]MDD3318090.1 DUF4352 domain-containing protein [Methanosarcina sp.]MDD4619961.1 DUF4352 domain-containing protein [Methanosarcina sp.]NLN44712.1 DUF4352 domain-containing protein [Methanosarcina sp.]